MSQLNEKILNTYTTIVENSSINWEAVKKHFASVNEIISYSDLLYHGTSPWNMLNILESGLELDPHREMGFDSVSVSNNESMLQFFGGSDDIHASGFVFNVKDFRLVQLNNFYYDIFAHETGMEAFWDMPEDEGNAEKIELAKKLGLVSRFGGFGIDRPDEFFNNVIEPLNIDGIIVPGFEEDPYRVSHNAESEIAMVNPEKLMGTLTGIVVGDEYFEEYDKADAIEYLQGLEHGEDVERYR